MFIMSEWAHQPHTIVCQYCAYYGKCNYYSGAVVKR